MFRVCKNNIFSKPVCFRLLWKRGGQKWRRARQYDQDNITPPLLEALGHVLGHSSRGWDRVMGPSNGPRS